MAGPEDRLQHWMGYLLFYNTRPTTLKARRFRLRL